MRRSAILLLLLPLALPGCDSSSGADPEPTGPAAEPTSVFVSTPKDLLESIGETVQLTAEVRDQNGNTMAGVALTWTSADPTVAGVDSSTGLVTAVANGSTVITATAGDATGAASITVSQVATGLSKAGGDNQEGTVGAALAENPTVVVRDGLENPVPGVTVTFAVTAGGGTVSSATALTDASGEAGVRWTLGTDVTETQTLTATALETVLEFSATPLAGPPSDFQTTVGDGQTGFAREALTTPLTVALADEFGNPLAGVAVTWAVTAGGGSITPVAATTDAAGQATATWTLGQTPGTQSATATVGTLTPLAFSATALANAVLSGTVTVQAGTLAPSLASSRGPGTRTAGVLGSRVQEAGDEVPGELIVLFREGSPATLAMDQGPGSSARAALASFQAEAEILEFTPSLPAALLRARPGEATEEVARRLENDPRVAAVQVNRRHWVGPRPGFSPSPPPTLAAPALPSIPVRQKWRMEAIGLPDGWYLTLGSAAVTVAILDDGIRFDHTALAGLDAGDGFDLVRNVNLPDCIAGFIGSSGDGDGPDADPTTPSSLIWNAAPADCVAGVNTTGGSGTFSAGIIGGAAGSPVLGVSPQIRIRPVRIVDISGQYDDWALLNGVLYAAGFPVGADLAGTVQASGPADIILFGFGNAQLSVVLQQAVEQADGAGSLLVAPVGDGGTTLTAYPAEWEEVLGVSGVGPGGAIGPYSNIGPSVDLAAPGGDQTSGDFSFGVYSTLWNFAGGGPTYAWSDGTTQAAAHVAGVAALLRASEPGISPRAMRDRLTGAATPATPTAWYGAGRLDALAALTNGQGLTGDLYVHLSDANTGEVLQTVMANPDGTFRFSHLSDGTYRLFAGEDRSGDGATGLAGRPWGAFGGTATPTDITVAGGGDYTATFPIATPTEMEGNDDADSANELPVGGYVQGELDDVADLDFFRVLIPEAGTYRFGTEGLGGACGLANSANTVVNVLLPGSVLLDLNDDRDAGNWDFCSQVEIALTPGIHYVQVNSSQGFATRGVDQRTGGYILWVQRVS